MSRVPQLVVIGRDAEGHAIVMSPEEIARRAGVPVPVVEVGRALKSTQIALRFPADMTEALRARATVDGVSVAELVRRFCRAGLEAQ